MSFAWFNRSQGKALGEWLEKHFPKSVKAKDRELSGEATLPHPTSMKDIGIKEKGLTSQPIDARPNNLLNQKEVDHPLVSQKKVAQSIGLSQLQPPPRTNLTPYPGDNLIFFNCSIHIPP